MLTVLVPAAIVGLILILGVIVFQRARDGLDLTPETILRGYLYLGTFAGIVAMTFGLSALLNGALASAVGGEIVYGFSPIPAAIRGCPPGQVCPDMPSADEMRRQQQLELDRRRQEDLVRGVTFAVFGAVFYGAHRAGRRSLYPVSRSGSDHGGLRRAYLLLGTIVFGVGAIALLPAGIYQLLANVLVSAPNSYRPGVADTLSGGIVSVVVWLVFLWAALRDARGGGGPFVGRGAIGGPPPETR
jgi:hypothetical protein